MMIVIRVEIPHAHEDPVLHDLIKRHMLHGSCGNLNPNAPCKKLKDGVCTKRYPQNLHNETLTDRDGRPLCRRRSQEDGGVRVNYFKRFVVMTGA